MYNGHYGIGLFSFGTACINAISPGLSILVLACFLKKNFNYNGEYTIKNKL
jgi:hypothetical protein